MNWFARLFIKAHVLVYQLSGGKLGATIQGLPVIILTTRGRKSGAARPVPVVPLIEGDQLYVIGSMGGAPRNPAWFLNLEANPDVDVQVGAERWRGRATVLAGGERDQVWARVTAAMPNFAQYQQKTTRIIPVARLSRQSTGNAPAAA